MGLDAFVVDLQQEADACKALAVRLSRLRLSEVLCKQRCYALEHAELESMFPVFVEGAL